MGVTECDMGITSRKIQSKTFYKSKVALVVTHHGTSDGLALSGCQPPTQQLALPHPPAGMGEKIGRMSEQEDPWVEIKRRRSYTGCRLHSSHFSEATSGAGWVAVKT